MNDTLIQNAPSMPAQAPVVNGGEAPWFLGTLAKVKLEARDTGGRFALNGEDRRTLTATQRDRRSDQRRSQPPGPRGPSSDRGLHDASSPVRGHRQTVTELPPDGSAGRRHCAEATRRAR